MSPLSRTMALLKSAGWNLVEKTEHWNGFAKRRVDLWGFCDCIAVREDAILAVQTTTAGHIGARYEKMRYLPSVRYWLDARLGNRLIHIHGWKKSGQRGKRKTWQCRKAILTLGTTGNVDIIWLADTGAVEMAQESCKVCGETIRGEAIDGMCGLCADDALNKRAREMAQEGEK